MKGKSDVQPPASKTRPMVGGKKPNSGTVTLEKDVVVFPSIKVGEVSIAKVKIENKIDGPSSSNDTQGGSNGASQNNKSGNDLTMLEIAKSDIDQNQETGRKRDDGSAKDNFKDASETRLNPKMRPNQRADKKLQVIQADLGHDMEAGRKKIK